MATLAQLGANSLLQRGSGGSPQTFTTIFEAVSISGFGAESELKEVTHFLSTAKEYIYGLPDGAEMDVTANFVPSAATHLALISDQTNRVTRDFKWVIRTAGSVVVATFSFAALVRSWNLPTISPNEAMQVNFKMKISGGIIGPQIP